MIKTINLIFLLFCLQAAAFKLPTEIIARPALFTPKKIRFQFQLDFRNSFVGRKTIPVAVYGVNVGLKFKEKYRFGVGFYFINQNSTEKTALNDLGKQIKLTKADYETTPSYFANRHLFLWYGTINFTYTILNNKFFILGLPLELGLGSYNIRFDNFETNKNLPLDAQNIANSNLEKLDNKPRRSGILVPFLGGVAITIKLHRYVYPQISGGYRKTIKDNDFRSDFDGFYYHIGYQINFLEIYNDIFKKRKKMEM